jgi:hypothetical protein
MHIWAKELSILLFGQTLINWRITDERRRGLCTDVRLPQQVIEGLKLVVSASFTAPRDVQITGLVRIDSEADTLPILLI